MAVDVTVRLETITCCYASCGFLFAVPYGWETSRREDHSQWYCPNGHSQHFPGATEKELALRQLARERAEHDQTKADRDSVKRRLKYLRSRVKNGVCPCCKRTFQNLQRHMQTKHPAFST